MWLLLTNYEQSFIVVDRSLPPSGRSIRTYLHRCCSPFSLISLLLPPYITFILIITNKTKPTTLTPLTTTGSSLRRLLVANYPFSTFCLSGYCLKEKGPFSTSRLSGYCLKVKGKSKLSIQYLSPFGVLSESERLIHKSTSPQVQKLKS